MLGEKESSTFLTRGLQINTFQNGTGWQWFFCNHTALSSLSVPSEHITIMYTSNLYTYTGGEWWQLRSAREIRSSESLSFLSCTHAPLFFSRCRFQTRWRSTGGKCPWRSRKSKSGRSGEPRVTSSSCWGDKTADWTAPGQFHCCHQRGDFVCPFSGFSLNHCLCGW